MTRFMLTLLNLINLSEKGMPEASLFLLYKENHSLYEWFNEAYGGE